jgi:hypothetical protein
MIQARASVTRLRKALHIQPFGNSIAFRRCDVEEKNDKQMFTAREKVKQNFIVFIHKVCVKQLFQLLSQRRTLHFELRIVEKPREPRCRQRWPVIEHGQWSQLSYRLFHRGCQAVIIRVFFR